MRRRIKMFIAVIAVSILSGIIAFFVTAHFYPPLNRFLYGGEFEIPISDIQFWVEKVPERNYYRVYAKYIKNPDTIMWWGHGIDFMAENGAYGSDLAFNPEDNKIYGKGWSGLQGDSAVKINNPNEWELVFYYLSEGKMEKGVFKPIFPKGTKFTFKQGSAVYLFSDAPAYYITIYFPGTLKKLEKEELEKGVLAKITEDCIKRYKIKKR